MRIKDLKRKISLRQKRKLRIRAKISGTASLPRLSIFRSNRRLYAQVIDDVKACTLAAVDGKKLNLGANKEAAIALANAFAPVLKEKKIEEVVFDRNGYLYHGVVASFAQALRDAGIRL